MPYFSPKKQLRVREGKGKSERAAGVDRGKNKVKREWDSKVNNNLVFFLPLNNFSSTTFGEFIDYGTILAKPLTGAKQPVKEAWSRLISTRKGVDKIWLHCVCVCQRWVQRLQLVSCWNDTSDEQPRGSLALKDFTGEDILRLMCLCYTVILPLAAHFFQLHNHDVRFFFLSPLQRGSWWSLQGKCQVDQSPSPFYALWRKNTWLPWRNCSLVSLNVVIWVVHVSYPCEIFPLLFSPCKGCLWHRLGVKVLQWVQTPVRVQCKRYNAPLKTQGSLKALQTECSLLKLQTSLVPMSISTYLLMLVTHPSKSIDKLPLYSVGCLCLHTQSSVSISCLIRSIEPHCHRSSDGGGVPSCPVLLFCPSLSIKPCHD